MDLQGKREIGLLQQQLEKCEREKAKLQQRITKLESYGKDHQARKSQALWAREPLYILTRKYAGYEMGTAFVGIGYKKGKLMTKCGKLIPFYTLERIVENKL